MAKLSFTSECGIFPMMEKLRPAPCTVCRGLFRHTRGLAYLPFLGNDLVTCPFRAKECLSRVLYHHRTLERRWPMATKTTKRAVTAPRYPERKWGPFHGGVGVAVWLNEVETAEGKRFFRSNVAQTVMWR